MRKNILGNIYMNEVVEMKYNSLEKKKDIKRGVQDGIPIALA